MCPQGTARGAPPVAGWSGSLLFCTLLRVYVPSSNLHVLAKFQAGVPCDASVCPESQIEAGAGANDSHPRALCVRAAVSDMVSVAGALLLDVLCGGRMHHPSFRLRLLGGLSNRCADSWLHDDVDGSVVLQSFVAPLHHNLRLKVRLGRRVAPKPSGPLALPPEYYPQ